MVKDAATARMARVRLDDVPEPILMRHIIAAVRTNNYVRIERGWPALRGMRHNCTLHGRACPRSVYRATRTWLLAGSPLPVSSTRQASVWHASRELHDERIPLARIWVDYVGRSYAVELIILGAANKLALQLAPVDVVVVAVDSAIIRQRQRNRRSDPWRSLASTLTDC